MSLVDRVKRILMSPRTEWQVIDTEPTTAAQLYTGYIVPLAAIGPIAQLIGYSVFGISVPFMGTYRVPIGSAISSALVTYVLSLAATYVLALIIDGLAPTFNGQRNQIQALKVAAYSSTASWVAHSGSSTTRCSCRVSWPTGGSASRTRARPASAR